MKLETYYLVFLFSLFIFSCSNKNESSNFYNIKGDLIVENDSIKVFLGNSESYSIIDSTCLENGKFTFQGKLEEPYPATLFFKNKEIIKRISFWVDSNNIELKFNLKEHKDGTLHKSEIKGSLNSLLDIGNYDRIMVILEKEEAELQKFTDSLKRDSIKKEYKKKRIDSEIEFAFNNPSYFSLNQIKYYRGIISKDSLRNFYNSISEKDKNTTLGKYIYGLVNYSPIKEGEHFKEIQGKDLAGNLVKLSNFKGKIIILDFWDRYCPPCRKDNKEKIPQLIEKYKNKDIFVVSFSLDQSFDNWKKASEEDNINWVNFSNLSGFKGRTALEYGIEARPTIFIINREGIISKKLIAPNFDEIFDEINKIL